MKFIVKTASGDPFLLEDLAKRQEEFASIEFNKNTHSHLYYEKYYEIRRKYNKDTELEINTLEELLAFSKEHGAIILSGNDITIYDDYVE